MLKFQASLPHTEFPSLPDRVPAPDLAEGPSTGLEAGLDLERTLGLESSYFHCYRLLFAGLR